MLPWTPGEKVQMDKQFIESIAGKINEATQAMVEQTIEKMLTDQIWIDKLEQMVSQRIVDKVSRQINSIDVNLAIKNVILENKEQLLRELASDFSSNGISDTAKDTQLTVMNDAVVVEKELYTTDLVVENDASIKGDLQVNGDLAIKGRVNVDNASWQELASHIEDNAYSRVKEHVENDMVNTVLDQAKQGIDFDNVTINGEYLVASGRLSNAITKSNLQEIGNLIALKVSDTFVAKNKRVGINTSQPDSALTIWDEEVSLTQGKHSLNTGFIGTSKKQDLVIGTNRQAQLKISSETGVWVEKLTINKNSISHGTGVPNYSGTKGDIVFNINHKPDTPFAWICLGNFRWNELRSV